MVRWIYPGIVCLLCMVMSQLRAQDVIYTVAGNKYTVKVTEVSESTVKYKEFSNPDGPTYVMSRNNIVLIEYRNGSTDVMNADPPAHIPGKSGPEFSVLKTPKATFPNAPYYEGKNFVSINAMALGNGDLTLLYDRDFLNARLGVTAIAGYNFNTRLNQILNLFVDQSYHNARKNYELGLGVNFYAMNKTRAQYFVGMMFRYMNLSYDKTTYYEQTINGFVFQGSKIERAPAMQTMIGMTNGIQVRVSEHFNFKFFITLGTTYYSPKPDDTSYEGLTKAYLGYCLGYRF